MQKINFVVRNYDFFKIKTVKDEHIRLLILKVDGRRSCLFRKLTKLRAPPSAKKKSFLKREKVGKHG